MCFFLLLLLGKGMWDCFLSFQHASYTNFKLFFYINLLVCFANCVRLKNHYK